MDLNTFETELNKVKVLKNTEKKPAYWTGYTHGLRRRYLRDKFGTHQEHHLWLTANGTKLKKLRAMGYRDGYGCKQNDGKCATCNLVIDMQDCQKNRI
jgi:hypothetical protein